MKVKKPSLKGMKHTEHLGHFRKDKYIQAGHNTSATFNMAEEARGQAREQDYVESMRKEGNPIRAKEYTTGTIAPYSVHAAIQEEDASAARSEAQYKNRKKNKGED